MGVQSPPNIGSKPRVTSLWLPSIKGSSSMGPFKSLATVGAILLQPADTSLKVQARQSELAFSPPSYPSPWMDPEADGWADAYAQARDFVSQMTLLEKVNITTGTG